MERAGTKWSEAEIELLKSDMSVDEIAEITGRTKTAIHTKRHVVKHKEIIPPPAKAPFELTVDYIYGQFRRMMGIGQRITLVCSALDQESSRIMTMKTPGVIKEKYPYYCKVKDIKTNEIKCVQWVDVARWNPELMVRKGA